MKKTSSKSTFSSLPQDIQVNIFLRLPVDSIVSCRCVCNPWRTLLRSPSFIKYHFNLTTQNNNPKLMLIDYIWDGGIKVPATYSIDYASISSYSSLLDSSCECNGAVPMDYPLEYNKDNHIDVLGSCNGLICMGISCDILGASNMLYQDASICIWNPSTGEYKKIPIHMRDSSLYNCCNVRYGFGYDAIINDYKLVKISGYENSSCFEVYTLGSSTWNSSQSQTIPYAFPYERRYRGLLFNGALHWLGVAITKENTPEVIVSLDISNENVLEVPLPEETILHLGDKDARRNLGTLSDCLCLVSNSPLFCRTDIWVIMEFGVDATWTKQFTFTNQIISKNLYLKPIWSLKNGEILFDVDYGFVLYDPSNGSQRVLNVQELQRSSITLCHRQPVIYMESLVSVNTGTYV